MDVFDLLSSLLMLICSIFGALFAFVFIITVTINRQCYKSNTLLVLNSAVAGFTVNVAYVCQSIYQLMNIGDDVLCPVRGFILHTGTALLYHSLCVIACHRLIVTVYSKRKSLQTKNFIIFMVVLHWLISCTFALPFLLTGAIQYQVDGDICAVKIDQSFLIEISAEIFSIIRFSSDLSFIDANTKHLRLYLLCIDHFYISISDNYYGLHTNY